MRWALLSMGGLAFAASLAAGGPAAAQSGNATEDPEAEPIVAAQIRSQGYRCDDPHSAERDAAASEPDEAVWILTCDNATYRVRLVPDMAAQVERID